MAIVPISIYDMAAWQAWLEDQAANGRFLDGEAGFFGLVASFTRGEPKAVRYRLEPLSRKEAAPEADRREVYRALGWEYVTAVGREFSIWRCDDPAAPELDTDPEVRAVAYERLRRRLRRANWIIGGMLVLLAGVLAALYAGNPAGFWESQVQGDRPAWLVLPTYTAMALLLWQWVYGALAFRRFLRTLRAGVPAPHRRPYRLARCLSAVGMAVYALYLVTMTVNLFRPDNYSFVPVEELEKPVPYVVLADLEGPQAIAWDNWLTRDQWWALQPDGAGYAESRYYRLHLPALAGPLAAELGDGLEPLDAPALDGAWWGLDDGVQTLVLRRAGQVYEIDYRGAEDLRDHLDAYAALLEEDG